MDWRLMGSEREAVVLCELGGGELRNKNVRLNLGSSELTRTAGARRSARATSRAPGPDEKTGELLWSSGYKRLKLIKLWGGGGSDIVHKNQLLGLGEKQKKKNTPRCSERQPI